MTQSADFNPDRMNNANIQQVGRAAYACVNGVDGHPLEAQVLGPAVMLIALAEHYGISPRDILNTASNLITDGEARHPQYRALRQYIHEELD